jgi:DNA-binding transcriptional regulator LsrR (DeoR family)
MAVAGGPHKIGAITDVLKRKKRNSAWITHLVTDDEVARHLCGS